MKIKNLRWYIIVLVMLGTITNYLSRNTLGIAAPTMLKDIGFTEQQYSYITAAFNFAYPVGGVFAGYIMDRFGVRWVFSIMAVLWSVFNALTGVFSSWIPMMILRMGIGLTESTFNPAGMKVSAEWFPPRERGLACGVYSVGTSAGAMLAPPVVAWSIIHYNWRVAFVVASVFGVLWSLIWFFAYRSPEKHALITREELACIGKEKPQPVVRQRVSPKSLLPRRNLWAISLPRMFADPTWAALGFWMPLYLVTVRHLDLKEIALFAWLPFLTADAGCLFAGLFAGLLNKYGITLINAKRITFTLAAFLMTLVPLINHVSNIYLAISLFCVAGFAHQCASITVISMSAEFFNENEVGTVTGFAGLIGGVGGFIGTLLIGAAVASIGYNIVFDVLGFLDLIGAAILWTLLAKPAPVPTAETLPEPGL
ncbi:TPA: MFS transporter [Klebsiella aerogenes]|nr:MFS transporter [Klebsiella aerogenes]HDT2319060.1 MFS transporter [Klebsiella aerogenes]HDU4094023.1 MFS transporter [Klebsiella aerogenes]HDU6133414.1 MFS transporter [Klebsiella aerogenes]